MTMAPHRATTCCLLLTLFEAVSASSSPFHEDFVHLLQKRANVLIRQPVADACIEQNRLEFSQQNLILNNLGNTGPDSGEEGMVFGDIFPQGPDRINMKISAGADYTKPDNRLNGVNQRVAKINLESGKKTQLTISFVNAGTGQPTTVGPFYLSFLDLDEQKQAGKAREVVTVYGSQEYEVTDATLVSQTNNGDGSITFASTTFGKGSDNPSDPETLNQNQMNKAVSVLMAATSSFNVDIEIHPLPFFSSRVFLFAGITNLPQVCAPTPAPTPSPTPSPTTAPTIPNTCGNVCDFHMAYKKCAFWGDPHYTKTFRGAPPHYSDHYDVHGSGVQTLAVTKCGSVEVQAVQCPWHGHVANVAAGLAMRVGTRVATMIGSTIKNDGGLRIDGSGNSRTMISDDKCVVLYINVRANGWGTPGRDYYTDIELKMDDPDSLGTCTGDRQQHPTPQDKILFTASQLQTLCGPCRFACPGALLQQDPDAAAEAIPDAKQICLEAGISYDSADTECRRLCEGTPEGCDPATHEACIMDYCAGDGDPQVIDNEIEFANVLDADDKGGVQELTPAE